MFGMTWQELLATVTSTTALQVALALLLGIPAVKIVSVVVGRAVRKRVSDQTRMLVRKGISWLGWIILTSIVLNMLGVTWAALLGALGVVGIALGFASQKSVSNIISGLFLISEKPFAVGDLITVGGTTGFVLSIDLLSVKIRTFDNKFVRLPNESLLSSEMTNVTRYPIRRMDIQIGVAYKERIERVFAVLRELAAANPFCLDEPEPLVVFQGFGESSLDFLIGLWFYRTDYLSLRESIVDQIHERFKQEGIEIPFPHRTLYVGSESKPFPFSMDTDPSAERSGLEPASDG